MTKKKILCLDFDGVIHQYNSGWQGETIISDDIVPGFFEWADKAHKYFELVIYSSRSKSSEARKAMSRWIHDQREKWRKENNNYEYDDNDPLTFTFAYEKPAAFLTIDDRCLTFNGDWNQFDPESIINFKPWNKIYG